MERTGFLPVLPWDIERAPPSRLARVKIMVKMIPRRSRFSKGEGGMYPTWRHISSEGGKEPLTPGHFLVNIPIFLFLFTVCFVHIKCTV